MTDMTHPYTDLKEALAKATPGPWDGNNPVTFVLDSPLGTLADVTRFHQARANAAFIALANPARILSLIEDNERMREALIGLMEEKIDYMKINLLGDPEKQYTIKLARSALKEKTDD